MALTKITERMKAKYGTRAEFVTAEAAGVFNSLKDGAVVYADGLPYKRESGATGLTGLPNWIPSGVPTFRHYGAAGDNSTDDTAACNAALAAHPNDIVDGLGLTYRIDGTLLGKKMRNAKLRKVGAGSVFRAAGSTGTISDPAVSFGQGDSQVQSGAIFPLVEENDWFAVIGDNDPYASFLEGASGGKTGELVQVKEKTGTNTIVLTQALFWPYTTNAQLATINWYEGVHLEDVDVEGDPTANPGTFNGGGELIDLRFCMRPVLHRVTVHDNKMAAIMLHCCVFASITDGGAEDMGSEITVGDGAGTGYGVLERGMNIGAVISGNRWERLRTGYTTGAGLPAIWNYGVPTSTLVEGNVSKSTKQSGMSTHPAGLYQTFTGNTIDSTGSMGINLRAKYGTIEGNTITRTTGPGVTLVNDGASAIAEFCVVRGNTLEKTNLGTNPEGVDQTDQGAIDDNTSGAVIQNNTIRECSGPAAQINYTLRSVVQGNTIIDPCQLAGTHGVDYAIGAGSKGAGSPFWVVSSNTIISNDGLCTVGIEAPAGVTVIGSGNTVRGVTALYDGDGIIDLPRFETRAAFVAAEAADELANIPSGTFLNVEGLNYRRNNTDTRIPDLPNWRPSEEVWFGHFANSITGAVADNIAIQAALDYAEDLSGAIVHLPRGTFGIDGANNGINIPDGVTLEGAGPGITTLRNTTDAWKMVIGVRGGTNLGVKNLTIDGDWPTRTPEVLANDPKRGEGLILWNGTSELVNAAFEDLEVINCGHYGIGAQNVAKRNVAFRRIVFDNIGGDALDIKSYDQILGSPEDPDLFTIVEGIRVKSFQQSDLDAGGDSRDAQAGVDLRGPVRAKNIWVDDTWGLKTGHTRKTGIRFNGDVNSNNRIGGDQSTLEGFWVGSSKPDADGNGTNELVIGLDVGCDYVAISNGYIENQYFGAQVAPAGDSLNPNGVSMSGVKFVNCKSDTTAGTGLDIAADVRRFSGTNLIADGCEIGFNVRGKYHYVQGHATNCTEGLRLSSDPFNQTSIIFDGCSTNVVDPAGDYSETGNVVVDGFSVRGSDNIWMDVVSTKDGTWTTGDWASGYRWWKLDESGIDHEFARLGLKTTGSTGGNFTLDLQVNSSGGMTDVITFTPSVGVWRVPNRAAPYTVANLPSSGALAGSVAYASNGRKAGEGVGAGSGVLVFFDGSDWIASDSGAAVEA